MAFISCGLTISCWKFHGELVVKIRLLVEQGKQGPNIVRYL